jgi:hypothetical protein
LSSLYTCTLPATHTRHTAAASPFVYIYKTRSNSPPSISSHHTSYSTTTSQPTNTSSLGTGTRPAALHRATHIADPLAHNTYPLLYRTSITIMKAIALLSLVSLAIAAPVGTSSLYHTSSRCPGTKNITDIQLNVRSPAPLPPPPAVLPPTGEVTAADRTSRYNPCIIHL